MKHIFCEVCLSDSSEEVARVIARYIVRKLQAKLKCEEIALLMIDDCEETSERDRYLNLLSRGGLIKQSEQMAEFEINSFALLDLLQKFIKSTPVKKLCQQALEKYAARPTFSSITHGDFCRKLAITITFNIFYNNKQKCSYDHMIKERYSERFQEETEA